MIIQDSATMYMLVNAPPWKDLVIGIELLMSGGHSPRVRGREPRSG
jgi:hypothetical protein